MAQWFIAAKKADFNGIAQRFHIDPVLARIIRNRDVTGEEDIRKYLHGNRGDMYAPQLLKDMDKAVSLLWVKIRQGAKIRIIGDYDADGICAAYILVKGLSACGADVDTVIPHRIKDGYGLNDSLIEEAAAEGIDTIVTCDNGIAAGKQISLAAELGMTVIVTDHHEVPFEEREDGTRFFLLPKAAAVIDPKQAGCSYPFPNICGAVVAYKLVQRMLECANAGWMCRQAAGARETSTESGKDLSEGSSGKAVNMAGMPEESSGKAVNMAGMPEGSSGKTVNTERLLGELLEIAAFATVCDVMELRDENRIIVKCGLERMQHTENMGLRALMEACGLEGKPLSAYHIGFVLGPCMNATGRLDTAKRALALLQSTDRAEAARLANELKDLNESRKEMTSAGVVQAVELIEGSNLKADKVLVVYMPEVHESLAGIIAGRLREKYGKPAFVLTMGEEEVKGSGRSIESYHMYEEMTACKEFFTKYGGHKMAAGLSMKEENVDAFRRKLNACCRLTEEDLEEKVHIDVAMPLAYITKDFVEELSLLEPFGVGNVKPVFAQKGIHILGGRILGKNRNVGKYSVTDGSGTFYDMMYFGDLEAFHDFLAQRAGEYMVNRLCCGERVDIPVSITYYPDINRFGGRESLQIVMQNYR